MAMIAPVAFAPGGSAFGTAWLTAGMLFKYAISAAISSGFMCV